MKTYTCAVCGYSVQAENKPDVCPVCGAVGQMHEEDEQTNHNNNQNQ